MTKITDVMSTYKLVGTELVELDEQNMTPLA